MTLLSKDEISTIKGMSNYWNEVSKREDTSPLRNELSQMIGILGYRILFILKDYVRLLEKEVE